ncbi:MAG: HAD-IC family P-type ATPase, partial [Rhodospirillales bacterium]|nr:HAD-IC family P-type ATPase [Rhodospirillales bacterium]
VFDKTGTLTLGQPKLVAGEAIAADALSEAAGLAVASRHPLARAVAAACAARGFAPAAAAGIREIPGCGLERDSAGGVIRLGSAAFCGLPAATSNGSAGVLELCFVHPDQPASRLHFDDALRSDAATVVARLQEQGWPLVLLSGDRAPVVRAVAGAVGIVEWEAGVRPTDKLKRLRALAAEGRRVLMVGDGLNDAPALAAAHASMSPASAIDIAQTAADVVFQGDRLAPVLETLGTARRAKALVRQNLALSFGYNLLAVPLAVGGQVTPLLAAIFMSSSSLLVILNALRLRRGRV